MSIQRWMEVHEECEPDDDGDYVRYSDHKIYLNEMRMDRDATLLQVAALREELERRMANFQALNREKNDIAYRANETAERLNSMTISKATMQNKLKQKLASTQQRLSAAEQRNAALVELLRDLTPYLCDWNNPHRSAMRARVVDAIKPAESLSSDQCAHSYANKIGCPECGEKFKPTESGASE